MASFIGFIVGWLFLTYLLAIAIKYLLLKVFKLRPSNYVFGASAFLPAVILGVIGGFSIFTVLSLGFGGFLFYRFSKNHK